MPNDQVTKLACCQVTYFIHLSSGYAAISFHQNWLYNLVVVRSQMCHHFYASFSISHGVLPFQKHGFIWVWMLNGDYKSETR